MEKIQSSFYFIFITLLHGILIPFSFLKGKFFKTFRFRFLKTEDFHESYTLIVPSSGELEYLALLYDELKKNHPVGVLYLSPSYEAHLEKNKTRYAYQKALPLDSFFHAFELNKIHPKLAIFGRFQVWPLLLFFLSKNHVKKILVSCNLRGKSLKNSFLHPFYRHWLSTFDRIYLEDFRDEEKAKELNLSNYKVVGNPRIDRVLQRQKLLKKIPWIEPWILNQKVIILASVWHEDLNVILSDLKELILQNYKIVLVPHEYNSSYTLDIPHFLSLSREVKDVPICIVNEIGLLFDLYQYAKFVYVGGAFNFDVHSTLEPASFGLPLAFGPNISRSGEAQDFVQIGGAQIVRNPGDLTRIIANNLDGKQNLHYLQKSLGASEKILEDLRSLGLLDRAIHSKPKSP